MKPSPKSIVFVTGAFLSHNCWNEWKSYFENSGYKCITPAWPNKESLPEELRNAHPSGAIASTRLYSLIDFFASIINALPEKPILIGHSLGGLIVQLLLQREIAYAGIAMHTFPPHGICNKLSFLRAVWKAAGFFTSSRKSYLISFKRWKYKIANELTCEKQIELYYAYAIPESKMVIRDSITSLATINFNREHAPLLFTSGNHDLITPASLNYNNYKKYSRSNSITGYKEFRNHNHLVFGHPAWREEAEFISKWLKDIQ